MPDRSAANTITAHLAAVVADLPVYVHTIAHADGLVLVDTGMIDSTPEIDEECAAVPMPENIPRDVVLVINTHLHFDHCGGNRLFPGVPIHVQRRELQDPYDPPHHLHPILVDWSGDLLGTSSRRAFSARDPGRGGVPSMPHWIPPRARVRTREWTDGSADATIVRQPGRLARPLLVGGATGVASVTLLPSLRLNR
ncbi:MAG TPA: MBL fold metallo-hydrolase [Gaiellaceae bacterium]|jgi:glyoxylase-like metal-dependent hydrolase (beta-lactamase superfamily II)|nr:MBL fold metallo-hydrolase [Gaiellaceae bacterium]